MNGLADVYGFKICVWLGFRPNPGFLSVHELLLSVCENTHIQSVKPCSHLMFAFAFFFDLCRQMQMLSMNTIICCHAIEPILEV